ncbi:MAG TPA: flavin reductase family protein [Dehalococcoidia bacterium]|nr:flavin reductase family protein [Dehalococcoidia bacterium]
MPLDPMDYRSIIGHFPTGVTVITTAAGEEMQGMTANAITSLSLDPLMVLVCIDKDSHTHRVLERGGVFAVNILGAHQEEVSRLFARHAEPELNSLRGQRFVLGETGAPILEDCLAFLECRVAYVHEGGDHSIFLGEVIDGRIMRGDVDPLVFFRGKYHALGDVRA